MFPHGEPPFHTGWWSIERSVPILLMLVLIGVVVWAVIRITRQPRAVPAGAGHKDPAVEQARMRYSRGEVDRDTFLQMVGDLSPGAVDPTVDDP